MPQSLSADQALAQKLLQCPSVTPDAGAALAIVADHLASHGFTITQLPFGKGAAKVDNIFARYGEGAPHFCFGGHLDVVPPGDEAAWQHPPFAGVIENDRLYGRGAVDMKGAVACFVTAVVDWLGKHEDFTGSISLLLTGDEEGDAIYGTKPVVDWLLAQKQMPDAVLVGEPTCPNKLGEMIKHGRRGSLNCQVTLRGDQGHVAYPNEADNPIHRLLPLLEVFATGVLDEGNGDFDPSTVMITSIDVGNPTANVIPSEVKARFNIRFGTTQTAAGLAEWLKKHFGKTQGAHVDCVCTAQPFITPPGDLTDIVSRAIHHVTGIKPRLSTSGGTSDARFIAPHCAVLEFGLVGQGMHKVNESVALSDLQTLTRIYQRILSNFFAMEA